MELELVGGSFEDTGTYGYVNGQYGYTSPSGQFSPMSPALAPNYQPPKQSGFATFLNNFFTPQRINAFGSLFTKKPQEFSNAENYAVERNNTGILVVSLVAILLIVVAVLLIRKKKK